MTRFKCGGCGRGLDKKTPFCPFCGARIGKARSRISPAALFIGIGAALVFCGMAVVIGLLLLKGTGTAATVTAGAEQLILRNESGTVAYPGDSVRITVDVLPFGAAAGPVRWSVSDEDIAEVDQTGVISFKSEGEFTVTAALENGVEGSLDLICGKRPYRLSFAKEEVIAELGQPVAIEPVVQPADADYDRIEWTSSDERIVRVESDGTLTAVAQGSAKLTASAGGAKSSINVFVYKYKFDLLSHAVLKAGSYDYTSSSNYAVLDEYEHVESGGTTVYGQTVLYCSAGKPTITLASYFWDEDDTFYYALYLYFERGDLEFDEFDFYCYGDPSKEGGSFHVPLSEAEPIEVEASGVIDAAEYRLGDTVEFVEYSGRDDFKDNAVEFASSMLTSALRALKTKWSALGPGCTIEEAIGLKKI